MTLETLPTTDSTNTITAELSWTPTLTLAPWALDV